MGCHALLQGIFPTQGWNLYPLCLLDWQVGSLPLVSSAAAAKSLQSYPTLCDPIDGSPPGSPVPGILQARTLERVAISFSNVWKWKVKVKSLSRVRLLVTPWTAAYQAPPSIGFSGKPQLAVQLEANYRTSLCLCFNYKMGRTKWIYIKSLVVTTICI